MPVKNIRHYRAREADDEKFEAFMEKYGIASTADFMHLIADHLDALEAALNSSQIATNFQGGEGDSTLLQNEIRSDGAAARGLNSSQFETHSGGGTLSQIATRLRGSEKVLRQYERQLQPDIFLTADLGDCKVYHVNNVRFNESVKYPSIFPEPENWSVEQRMDYFHRLENEWELYGGACYGVRDFYDGRRDLPLDFNDDPKIKTKYGWITQLFLEYHPWYVHPEWCDFHLLRDLDHEQIRFPELDGPEGTQQVLDQLDAHPMQGPLRDMRYDHGEVDHWLV